MNTCECYISPNLVTDTAMVQRAEAAFAFVKHARGSWDSLYRCRVCGQYWEMNYPGAGDVCCVEPTVQKMSPASADEKYGVR